MKLLNSFFIFIITAQMSLAGESVIQSYNASLEKWDQEFKQTFYQSVTLEMNKLLSNSDELKKRINKNPKISPKDRQLFNKDVAQIDQKLLRQVKVNLKNGKHIISIPQFKNLVFNLKTLPKGYITIDGWKLSTKDLHNYQKLQEFFSKKYAAQKTSSYNLIISSAYAVLPLVVLVPLLSIAVVIMSEAILSTVKIASELRFINVWVKKYEKHFHSAISECDADKAAIMEQDFQSQTIRNDTLIFIKKIERFSKDLHRTRKRYDDNFLSCKNIRESSQRGDNGKTMIFNIQVIKRVGEMCKMAKFLQECLDETKALMKEKNLTIDTRRHFQNSKTSYDDLIYYFSGSVLK